MKWHNGLSAVSNFDSLKFRPSAILLNRREAVERMSAEVQ